MIITERPEAMSEAAFWQERKAHWIKEGIDPIIAGELAWSNLAGYTSTPETMAEAIKSDRGATPDGDASVDLGALEGLGFAVKDEPAVEAIPAGQGRDPRCGARWGGFRVEHCTVCHQTFSGETTGMAHRVGPYDQPGQRRCLDADELKALGLWAETNQYGTDIWHGSPNKQGIQKRRPTIDKKEN